MSTITRRALTTAMVGAVATRAMKQETERWLVYYSDREPFTAFAPYSFLIFDSRYHPPLTSLAESGKKLAGYVSLGEAAPDYSYFRELDAQGLLVKPSPTWKGNYYIDIRDAGWAARVCEDIVPRVLAAGFHGLFLDTLDSPLHLEMQQPAAYSGMAKAATGLVHEIRRRFPQALMIMNRAYALLEDVATDLDIVMGESVYSTYDFRRMKYELVSSDIYRQQVKWLRAAASQKPALRVFTLDYWEPGDLDGIARIYREERAHGFSPYVASIDLTKIVREPGVVLRRKDATSR